MKILPLALAAFLVTELSANLRAQDGTLDLTALSNYTTQTIPFYITKNNTPANNRISNAGATLGRVLFYDRRLSRNNTVSCSSCHDQAHAFSDPALASTGVNGTTTRHATRLINDRFGTETHFFWDERATSLENQATQPIRNFIEMGYSGTGGDPAFTDLLTKLSSLPEYRVLFTAAFGTALIDETKIQRALAQFVRSIQSFDSKYDSGRAVVGNDNAGFPNFTTSENAGKQLFLTPPPLGGAGCAACHRPPEFDIDPNSRNNGVVAAIGGGTDTTNTRSPTLRDLIGPGAQSNGPFMHNGSLNTLASVINHYNAIPAIVANLDPRLTRGPGVPQSLNLSAQQKNDLVAFLQTLAGTSVYSDPRWSDPFTLDGQIFLHVLPASGVAIQGHSDGSVTVGCKAAVGLQYQLEFSTDFQTWSPMATMTPDANGNLSKVVLMTGPVFYRFTFTPPAPLTSFQPASRL